MDSNSFWKFYLIYCLDANSVSRVAENGRRSGGVGFLTTRRSELHVLSDSGSPIGSLLHHTPKLGIRVLSVHFLMKLLLKQRVLAVYHDFHWVLVAIKFLAAKLHSLYLKESDSEILERSELEWKFGKGRGWCQTFYFRLRNPGCYTWMTASISLVVVMQSNFGNRYFFYSKFSIRSGEFPGQSITFNFASWKSSSYFQMKNKGQYPIGIFLHHQKNLSLFWNGFSINYINVFV